MSIESISWGVLIGSSIVCLTAWIWTIFQYNKLQMAENIIYEAMQRNEVAICNKVSDAITAKIGEALTTEAMYQLIEKGVDENYVEAFKTAICLIVEEEKAGDSN